MPKSCQICWHTRARAHAHAHAHTHTVFPALAQWGCPTEGVEGCKQTCCVDLKCISLDEDVAVCRNEGLLLWRLNTTLASAGPYDGRSIWSRRDASSLKSPLTALQKNCQPVWTARCLVEAFVCGGWHYFKVEWLHLSEGLLSLQCGANMEKNSGWDVTSFDVSLSSLDCQNKWFYCSLTLFSMVFSIKKGLVELLWCRCSVGSIDFMWRHP